MRPEPARDDQRQLDGRGGDQPDPLAGVEVHLGQRAGARPDPVGHQLVVDLLAELDELGHRAARRRTTAPCSRWARDVLGRALGRRPGTSAAARRTRAGRSVVKNLRAARPRAKWKIDAPIIIVLSTSKNAAAVRSGGTRVDGGHLVDVRGVGRRGRGRRTPARELAVGGAVDSAAGVRAGAVRNRLEELRGGGRAEGGVPHRGLGRGLTGASRRVALRLYPALAPSSHRRVLPCRSRPGTGPPGWDGSVLGGARPA